MPLLLLQLLLPLHQVLQSPMIAHKQATCMASSATLIQEHQADSFVAWTFLIHGPLCKRLICGYKSQPVCLLSSIPLPDTMPHFLSGKDLESPRFKPRPIHILGVISGNRNRLQLVSSSYAVFVPAVAGLVDPKQAREEAGRGRFKCAISLVLIFLFSPLFALFPTFLMNTFFHRLGEGFESLRMVAPAAHNLCL
ncbi:hypothetical protein CY35_01G159400 [Sphagnum magellanicum]|nr:hypothetical protein CY35_01G159400 [Sphagnum magellanicum]